MFCPWPLQSDKIMQFSSWKDLPFFLIVSGLVLSPFYPVFFKNSSVFKKLNLFRFFLCVFLSYKFFLPSFFHHFLFLFITFRIHHFSFFCLTFLFSWSPSSWTHFSFPSLSLIFFVNNNFLFVSKNSSTFHIFTCMRYLFMSSFWSSICSSIVFFSLLVVSVCEKQVFAFSKAFNLFVRHLHKFVCFCMFVLLSVFFSIFLFLCVFSCVFWTFSFFDLFLDWTFVFPMFLFFVVLFECIFFFFFENSLWFDYTFSAFSFSFYILSFIFKNHVFLLNRVCCLLFLKKKSLLLLPVFSLHQRKLCHWKFVVTHFETSVFELFTFTSTKSTFSLSECLLCLFVHSFCSSSNPLVLSVSPCFLVSFIFSLFLIFFFLGLGLSLKLSFSVFFCSQKRFCLFPFFVGHALHLFFMLCIVFLCLEK